MTSIPNRNLPIFKGHCFYHGIDFNWPVMFHFRFKGAHSAAQAAVAVASSAIRRQWHRLSRGPEELATMEQSISNRDPPAATPTDSSRAITIARLRKWAGRKAAEALSSHTSGSFRALLRRANRRAEPVKSNLSCMREARSALTSPTSSQTELPPFPVTLTHSASGHLVGHRELSSDDLEYKVRRSRFQFMLSTYCFYTGMVHFSCE